MALGQCLLLTPPVLHHTPVPFRRADGASKLRPKGHEVYTSHAVIDAEARLLDAGRRTGGPTVGTATVAAVTQQPLPGRADILSVEQAVAVEQIATSSRVLDVLVGPAGTGKSTTMAGLRAVWEAEHGPGSVIGLAPSAAAAEVLAAELGIDTENTAKWLTEHRRLPGRQAEMTGLRARIAATGRSRSARTVAAARAELDRIEAEVARWQLRPRQLVIVDEASLSGTFALDELVTAAADAGAKVLLVGDWAQLSAVDAGGMFRALATDRDQVPELSQVRRFRSGWERHASLGLRTGDDRVIDAYLAHDRIVDGPRDQLLEALYVAWRADTDAGKTALMIAPDRGTVALLNARARADRIAAGQVADDGVPVAGGVTVGVGDLVVTRQNDRRVATGSRWVRNGDRWTVTAVGADESLTVRRADGGGQVILPAGYVAEHVELGYATTAHRAEGRTVDTAHALISPTTTREVLYVLATRGRESNRIYVDTHYDPDPQTGHDGAIPVQTAREVLAGVLANQGAEVAAHETIRRAHHDADSIATLAAEYQTIAAVAQAERWDTLLERSGLNEHQLEAITTSDARGPLYAALRDAQARGLDIDTALPDLVRARTLIGSDDIAAVLHHRVDRWVDAARHRRTADNLIAGIIPKAVGISDPDMALALSERDEAIQRRADFLVQQAVEHDQPWLRRLGPPPTDPARRAAWQRRVTTVAAYRERWSIHGDTVVGTKADVSNLEQLGHYKHARAAVEDARTLTYIKAPAVISENAAVQVGVEPREEVEL